MKKRNLLFLFLVFALALVVWAACTATNNESVEGVPGIEEITLKWEGSGHADASSEAYTHWNENDPAVVPTTCAKCHSTSGFRDYVGADGSAAGVVDVAGNINDPISCSACHNSAAHALDSVTYPNGTTVSGTGNASACMTCHSGMGSGQSVADRTAGIPDDEMIPESSLMGNHYFAAAAVNQGSDAGAGFQYEGKSYVGAFQHAGPVNTCVECHDPHSTHLQAPEEGNNICQGCHASVEGYATYKSVNRSDTDYDGDGVKEPAYDEIEGMKAILVQAIGAYAKNVTGNAWGFLGTSYPYGFIDTNSDGTIDESEAIFPNQFNTYTPRMLKAAYNFMFTTKEPGAYVHNPHYVLQLMYDSIEDLSAQSGITTEGLTRP